MNFFSAFAASFGCMLLMIALIGSWLFRSADAPLVAKIVVPILFVALACATPYQVNSMLGFPISAPPGTLPAHAELIAFAAVDDDMRVDLWLRQTNAPPRAYETRLDDTLKRTLRQARARLDHGGRAMLVKARMERKPTGINEQRAPEESSYELDDSALSLPAKD